MTRDGDPARLIGNHLVSCFELLAIVDRQLAIKREPNQDGATCQLSRDTLAAATDIDGGVPADLPTLPVGGVIADARQRTECPRLAGKPLGHDLLHRPVAATIRLVPQPVLGELIEMHPTIDGAVADEEVVLDVADHAFVLALRLRPGRSARARYKPIVSRQIHKSWMEPGGATLRMRKGRRRLIVHQHLGQHAAKPLEAPDQPVIGVCGVLAVRAPEVESS